MRKSASVTLQQMQDKWGWDADRPELHWMSQLDGAATGFRKDGKWTAAEVTAGLTKPRAALSTGLLTSQELAEARKLLATPAPYANLPKALRPYAEAADTNHDAKLSNDELSTLIEKQPNVTVSDQRLTVLAAQIAALTGETTALSFMGDVENRNYFRVDHDGVGRVPKLVTYTLSAADLTARRELLRVDQFRGDAGLPKGTTGIPGWYDFSGYDLGHLMPCEDYSNVEGQRYTFLMSNIAPQTPELNQHGWRALEDSVRDLIRLSGGTATVATGVLFQDENGHPQAAEQWKWIGPDKGKANGERRVAVPTHFYKAISLQLPNGKKFAWAYLVPNTKEAPARKEGIGPWFDERRLSVAALERIVGRPLLGVAKTAEKRDSQGLQGLLRQLIEQGAFKGGLGSAANNGIETMWPADLALPTSA